MQTVILILALGFLTGTETAIPPKSPFTFPDTIPAPAPVPVPPLPKPATATLTLGVWYVVESKVDAIPRVHPANLAKVTKEVGPVTLKGVFVDGNGQVETRKYTAPYLFYVEPTGVGTVEIDFIPVGLKTESEIGFRTIQVDNGQGPQPPPGPLPPPTDPLQKTLQDAYNLEPPTVTAGTAVYLKSADKTSLAAVLRQLSTTVKDPLVKNGDDNFNLLHGSLETVIDGRLKVKLRPVIGAEINKILPNGKGAGTIALTDQNRKDASALYLRIADLLDTQVK